MLKNIHKKNTLPIQLFTEGKCALVVGGGKVAARKTTHCLDSGLIVTVVSPETGDDMNDILNDKNVIHKNRKYEKSDILDKLVVFAATSDKIINSQIIAECKKEKTLCCSSDENWKDGNFITPAIYRDEEITLTVSSDGKNCRKSKLIKDTLVKHLNRENCNNNLE